MHFYSNCKRINKKIANEKRKKNNLCEEKKKKKQTS